MASGMVAPTCPLYPAPMSPDTQHVPAGMAHAEFRAMGTTVTCLLPTQDFQRGEALVQALFADWEKTLSRFLPESELSQLNQLAGRPVIVGPLLYRVMSRALDAAKATDGLYDPSLLTQLVELGYDRSFEKLTVTHTDNERAQHIAPGGRWREIILTPMLHQITLPEGVQVDFGGIAKGMAVDAAIEQLRQAGIQPALVNAGGDLAVLGVPIEEQQWPIAVQGKMDAWTIPLHHGAFATSGIARRHWQQGALTRHHLLDPRTGLPARSGLWSVTVAASRCEQAEVAAKVAFLLGRKQGSKFLQQHSLAGLLVEEEGSWTTVGPWPADAMREAGTREVIR